MKRQSVAVEALDMGFTPEAAALLGQLSGLHSRIAKDAGISRARVRCEVCGREQNVNGGTALAYGWPKCHGYTMTLLPANTQGVGRHDGASPAPDSSEPPCS